MSRIVFAFALVMGLGSLSFSADSEPRPPRPTEIDQPDIQERLAGLPALRAQLFVSDTQVEQDGRERSSADAAGVKRTQTVKVNPTAVNQLMAAVPLRLDREPNTPTADPTKHVLNFFDVDLNVVNLEQKRNELGLIVWRGTVVGDPYSSVTLVFDNGAITGRVMTQGQVFAITPMEQGRHRISEIDEQAQPSLEDDAIRPPVPEPGAAKPSRGPNSGFESPQAEGDTIITVLVVYTPTTLAESPNIRSELSLAVAWLNTALTNSEVTAQVRIAGIDQVNYTNAAPTLEVITDAQRGVEDFARIHDLRAALDADLLSVWAFEATENAGRAYLLDNITEFPNQAERAVSLVAYPNPDLFAHEIGHNLGGRHDRYTEKNDQPGPAQYNFGYVDTDAQFRTIMAYPNECWDLEISCPKLQYFSNPGITVEGAVIGIDADDEDAAHNAREFNENIDLVADLGSQLADPASPILATLVRGTGSVVSEPAGIDCGNTCSAQYDTNQVVTLTAQYVPGWAFESWSGACSGYDRICEVTLSESASVTASFMPVVLPSVLFSSKQTTGQSFLRFYNAGPATGTVRVDLSNQETGAYLSTYTSPPIAAGASIQVAVTDVEFSLDPGTEVPAYFAATVRSDFEGWLQHVLWSPVDGTLTNLSTCDFGVTGGADALANVHTSQLDYGYPSSVVVTNRMNMSSSFTLGLYNAANGEKLATYETPELSRLGGQVVTSVADIEEDAGIDTEGINHFVIRVEGSSVSPSRFYDPEPPAFLQHLVSNIQAGVITDMTTVCSFSDPPAPYPTVAVLRTGSLFSSEHSVAQSFLRFHNNDSSAGSVLVTLSDQERRRLGEWTSNVIQPGASVQVAITEVESGISPGRQKPKYYSASLQTEFDGWFQHVLWSPADGTLTNLSTCEAGISSNRTTLNGVHTSRLQADYPSTVVVNNTSAAGAPVTLGLYNATTGDQLGTYNVDTVPGRAQAVIPVTTLESGAGVDPNGAFHYVIQVETQSFPGFLQHVVDNRGAGVITDMTTACALPALSLELGNKCESSKACPLSVGESVAGQIKDMRPGIGVWYVVDLKGGQNYSIDVKGLSDGQGTLWRPNFRVWDRGDPVFTDDDEGPFTPSVTGKYRLAVTGSTRRPGESAGTFVVTVEESE